jgi:hypothetical protein
MVGKEEFKPPHLLFQWVSPRVLGVILLVVGLLLLFKPELFPWLAPEQQRSFTDALLVASLLTLVVDPFIKGRLYREVSAGAFQYLLGFVQPPEIQDALWKLAFETKVYARDLRLDCCIEREDERNVRLRIRSTVRIENPTSQLAEHEPKLAFEEAERPAVDNITVRLGNETRVFQGNLKPDENRILEQGTDCFVLAPKESMMAMYSYSVVLPDRFFYTHFFRSTNNRRDAHHIGSRI